MNKETPALPCRQPNLVDPDGRDDMFLRNVGTVSITELLGMIRENPKVALLVPCVHVGRVSSRTAGVEPGCR
jgi:hypothetical protein